MAKRQRKIATRCIVAGLLIATSGCALTPTTNSTEENLIVGTIDVEQETETKVEITGMKSEAEEFQEQYEKELAILSKEMGLPVSDVSPYCDRGYVITTGDSLNVREKPDVSSRAIAQLEPGTIVRVVRKENDFYRVVFQEEEDWQVGYAYNECIKISYKDVLEYELVAVSIMSWPAKANDENRNYNMSLACQKIDGLVIKPGEEFNWYGPNGVGPATEERDFKLAGVIANGSSALGYGGGVCQVATALYNDALQLELKILERHEHSHTPSYAPEGKDATVDFIAGKNLVFENTTDFPIWLEAYAEKGQAVAIMYRVID